MQTKAQSETRKRFIFSRVTLSASNEEEDVKNMKKVETKQPVRLKLKEQKITDRHAERQIYEKSHSPLELDATKL